MKRFLVVTMVLNIAVLTVGVDVVEGASPPRVIDPKVCPSTKSVENGLSVTVLNSSHSISKGSTKGSWSVNSCQYLTTEFNKNPIGPSGMFKNHVVITFSWPVPKGLVASARQYELPPVVDIPNLGDIAYGQTKYFSIRAQLGSIALSMNTPDTSLSKMTQYARRIF